MPESSAFRRAVASFGRLFDFDGRTTRSDYWRYIMLLLTVYAAGLIALLFAAFAGVGMLLGAVYALVVLIALLACAATVRRLHDVGWSGWWMGAYLVLLIAFVAHAFYWRYVEIPRLGPGEVSSLSRFFPLLTAVTLAMWGLGLLIFVLAVLDGTPGPNRYGPDPKDRTPP